jgi:hypothetical protein
MLFVSCNKPSTIEVQNNLLNGTLKNVYWGEIPIAHEILPDETSGQIKIYEDAHYNLDFPEEFTLQFTFKVDGKEIILQTNNTYKLGREENLLIFIDDSTKVSEVNE